MKKSAYLLALCLAAFGSNKGYRYTSMSDKKWQLAKMGKGKKKKMKKSHIFHWLLIVIVVVFVALSYAVGYLLAHYGWFGWR